MKLGSFFAGFTLFACVIGCGSYKSQQASTASQSTLTDAQRLCWQFTTAQKLLNSVDSENLSVLNQENGKYDPLTLEELMVKQNEKIECLSDKVIVTKKSKESDGKELIFKITFVPTRHGGVSETILRNNEPVPNVTTMNFFGDGVKRLSVLIWDEAKDTAPTSVLVPIATVFGSMPPYVKCNKTLAELESSGVKFMKSGSGIVKLQRTFELKPNGKYSYEDRLADDAKLTFATDVLDVTFECTMKPLPSITNLK